MNFEIILNNYYEENFKCFLDKNKEHCQFLQTFTDLASQGTMTGQIHLSSVKYRFWQVKFLR